MPFLVIWFIITFIATLVNVIGTLFDAEYEKDICKFAFNTQRKIWRQTEDEYNIAGRIIIEFVMTVFLLPSNVFLWFIKSGEYVCGEFVELFRMVFRKR